MPEMTDRLPGEIIFASFSNQLIRRSAQRYADRTARDSENPIPETGDLAYITTLGLLEIFNGAVWKVQLDSDDEDALNARLNIFENKVWIFNDGKVTVTGSIFGLLASFNIVTAGDYMFTCQATIEVDWPSISDASTGAFLGATRLQVNGADPAGWGVDDIQVGVAGNGFGQQRAMFQWPVAGLNPGDLIEFEGRRQNGISNSVAYVKRSMYIEELPAGIA